MSVMSPYVFYGFCQRTRLLSNMAPRKQRGFFLLRKAKKRRAEEKRTGAAELLREELQAPIGVDSDSDARDFGSERREQGCARLLERPDGKSEVAPAYVGRREGGLSFAGWLACSLISISAICCRKKKSRSQDEILEWGRGERGSVCAYLCVWRCTHSCRSPACVCVYWGYF